MFECASNLLITYKYWIVIAGALLEGEAVLLMAGASAYHGHINIYMVMLIAFIGAVIHDHVLFFVGRHMGRKIFVKYPKVNEKYQKVSKLLHKHDNLFIFGFRFVYGIRTLTPMILGTTAITLKKYSLLTVISAFLWATSVAYIGYSCALIIEEASCKCALYQKYFTIGLIVVIGLGWLGYVWWKRPRG